MSDGHFVVMSACRTTQEGFDLASQLHNIDHNVSLKIHP